VKTIILIVMFFLVLAGNSHRVYAQVYGTDFHTVTVSVATLNIVQVTGGGVGLTLGAGAVTAGVDLMGPVTNSSTTLLWGFNSTPRSIFVQTDPVAKKFILKVLAVAPTAGTASPEVTLSTTPKVFLSNAGRSSGSCTLQYSGYALASAGTGTDSHVITFTIVAQ
jgi:hypothetical protein